MTSDLRESAARRRQVAQAIIYDAGGADLGCGRTGSNHSGDGERGGAAEPAVVGEET
jgi:hypothetical protein